MGIKLASIACPCRVPEQSGAAKQLVHLEAASTPANILCTVHQYFMALMWLQDAQAVLQQPSVQVLLLLSSANTSMSLAAHEYQVQLYLWVTCPIVPVAQRGQHP